MSRIDHVFHTYRGLTASQARDQAQCEARPFTWTDTREVCRFKCRCEIHEIDSVTHPKHQRASLRSRTPVTP